MAHGGGMVAVVRQWTVCGGMERERRFGLGGALL